MGPYPDRSSAPIVLIQKEICNEENVVSEKEMVNAPQVKFLHIASTKMKCVHTIRLQNLCNLF